MSRSGLYRLNMMLSSLGLSLLSFWWLHAIEAVNFDAMPATCQADNWGMPLETARKLPKDYYDKTIRTPCQAQWKATERPASEALETATAIHSVDTQQYDDFTSTDWIPENKNLYNTRSSWGKKFDFVSYPAKKTMASSCHLENEAFEGKWELTRIGPFRTTGGYDWLQVGWDDLFGVKEILKKNPDGIYIMEQFMSPVLEDGTRLDNPPIHIHHMHVGPAPYVRQRFSPIMCSLFNTSCFNPFRAMENHGDYNCKAIDGGLDCRIESFPKGYGKLVMEPLGLEGELNDVRPSGSGPLEWYFEIGMRWVPKSASSSYRPMSLHNLAGPGLLDTSIQKSLLITFPVPTAYESVFWYTGRMNEPGTLLRNKIHAHNTLFQEALFFAASPDDLGMTVERGFVKEEPFRALPPSAFGLATNADVKAYLLENLKKSQSNFDASPPVSVPSCGYPNAACHVNRPDIVCQAFTDLEVIDGFAYDRRQPMCCSEWTWEGGQVFTVVGFNKHQGYPVGPHKPNMEDIPEYLPGHVGWWLSYKRNAQPAMSMWGYSLYNHFPEGGLASLSTIDPYQRIAIFFNGYTSTHYNDWRYVPYSGVSMIIIAIVRNRLISALFLAGLIGAMVALHLRQKKLAEGSHKKSDSNCAEYWNKAPA